MKMMSEVKYTDENMRKLAGEIVSRLSADELGEIVFTRQLEVFMEDEDVFQACWEHTYKEDELNA
jgi:hypothetical protein|tara:strand:+ start:271 stop:465 length:195 start_codon:yes stop_codon:yes gene_type:complete